ncbi:hypothetical protein ACFL3A_03685 [Pseudomonadota bacterium]
MMYRCYFYLAAFVAIMTTSVSALAETAVNPSVTDAQNRNWTPTENEGGFYTSLPAVNNKQLVGLIRNYQEALTQREQEITRYLDENRLDTADVLITVVMPGGLIYAAVRKANLEEARAELTEITDDMDELSRDLLAMQAGTGELTLAQLQ